MSVGHPSRLPYIISSIIYFCILNVILLKVRCRIHVCHVDDIDFWVSFFALLDHESFEGFLVFQTCLLLDGHRWYCHLLLYSADGTLSDCRHHIAFDEELFDGFYQVLLHLAVVMGHTYRHDKFGRTSAILVQGDSV